MLELAVPVPNLAAFTVPDVRLVAFRFPLKDKAVNMPVDGTKDNLEEETFCGIFPEAAVTQVGNTMEPFEISSVMVVVVAVCAVPVILPLMAAVTVKPDNVPTEVIKGWAPVVTVPAVVAEPALPVVL